MKRSDVYLVVLFGIGVLGVLFAYQGIIQVQLVCNDYDLRVGQACQPTNLTISTSAACSEVRSKSCGQAESFQQVEGIAGLVDVGGCTSTTQDTGCSSETRVANGASATYEDGGNYKRSNPNTPCNTRKIFECTTAPDEECTYYQRCVDTSIDVDGDCGANYTKPDFGC